MLYGTCRCIIILASDNEKKIKAVDELKNAFLFSSDDLLQILDTTPSVKTRIRMIGLIGPRLTDPKAKASEILGLFRYAEEKNQVEEILKHRAHTVANNVYISKPAAGPGRGGMMLGGGRGGRGRGGRGMRSTSPVPPVSITAAPERETTPPGSSRRATSPAPIGGPKGCNPLDIKRSPRSSPPVDDDEEVMVGSRAPFSSIGAPDSEDVTPVSEIATPPPEVVTSPEPEASPVEVKPPAQLAPDVVESASSATIAEQLADSESTPTTQTPSIDVTPTTENATAETFNAIDVEIASVSSSTSLAQQIDHATTPSVLLQHRPPRRSSVSDSVLRSLGLTEETLDDAPEECWVEKYEKRISQQEILVEQERKEEGADQEVLEVKTSNGPSSEQPAAENTAEAQEPVERKEEAGDESTVAKEDPTQLSGEPASPEPAAENSEAPATGILLLQYTSQLMIVGLRAWFRRISFTQSTPPAPTPPDASSLDRQPRSSLQKLQEEKKVGLMRRLFERKEEAPEAKPELRREHVASDIRRSQLGNMPCEGPIGQDTSGRDLYTYHELVRRNAVKDFSGVNPNELELHLSDEEFIMRFNATKVTQFVHMAGFILM